MEMASEFNREVEEKARAAGLSTEKAILLGFAAAKTGVPLHDLFETLLDRPLADVEQAILSAGEDEQHDLIGDFIGQVLPVLQ